MNKIVKGQDIAWRRNSDTIKGKVIDITPDTVTIVSKGHKVTRDGTHKDPAVIIECKDSHILKLKSELR